MYFFLFSFYSHSSGRDDLNEVMRRYKELNEARDRYTKSVYRMIDAQEVRTLRQYWKEEQERIEKTQRDDKEARKELLETLKNHIGEREVLSLMILIENYIYYSHVINLTYDKHDGYEFPMVLHVEYDEANSLVQFFAKYFLDRRELKAMVLRTFQHLQSSQLSRIPMSELRQLAEQWGPLRMRQNLYKYQLTDSIFTDYCENSFSGGRDRM